MTDKVRVYLESGKKKVFASAIDWPGWSRAGRDASGALAALAAYAERYEAVAREAGMKFPVSGIEFDVLERVGGGGATDFGVPEREASSDREPLDPGEADRLARLVEASWRVFDDVVARAPAELRKGPRGGGRDRDRVVAHVLGGESGYSRRIGLRFTQPEAADREAVAAARAAIAARLRAAPPPAEKGWPVRYAARRIAWHVLDHAWEIEDRADSN